MNLINSKFELNGASIESLERDLAFFDKVTHVTEGNVSEVVLMCPNPDKDRENGKGVRISSPIDGPKNGVIVNTTLSQKHDECFEDSAGMMECHGLLYFMDPNLVTSLAVLVELGGRSIQYNLFERNDLLAKLFSLNDKAMKFVYRQDLEDPKQVKAFHAFTSRYSYCPQSKMMQIIKAVSKDMGKINVTYSINHYRTLIRLEFPEIAKDFASEYGFDKELVPGILIANSDVGTTALTVRGTLRTGESTRSMCFGKVLAKHEGEVSAVYKRVLEEIEKKIYPEYRSYMERFIDLLSINIEDPVETIGWIFEKVGMIKAIGKKNTTVVKSFLISEIDKHMKYTAYDIVIMLLDMVDRVEKLNYESSKNFSEALNKVVFLNFDEEEETIEIKR